MFLVYIAVQSLNVSSCRALRIRVKARDETRGYGCLGLGFGV